METIVIIGRPNVGKSTLFNRLTDNSNAIVDDLSGISRDRHFGEVIWNGRKATIIDTGGYIDKSKHMMEKAIKEQVDIAIGQASHIIWMVDVRTGITTDELMIAKKLKLISKKIFLCVNKVDDGRLTPDAQVFYRLGFQSIYCIAANSGFGTGELLDDLLPATAHTIDMEKKEDKIPTISIVGQPNVGKSSFLNLIAEEKLSIVTEQSGTTRDALFHTINKFGMKFNLIDTAGIKRKDRVKENIEFYAEIRSIKAIQESDVCILLVDALENIRQQDLKILNTIIFKKKGVMIAVNKWDLIAEKVANYTTYKELILKKCEPFDDLPIHFISIKEKQRVLKCLQEALAIFDRKIAKIPTAKLNNTLLPIFKTQGPAMIKGKNIKIKYITQLPAHFPIFALYCNLPQYIKQAYYRFVENQLRKNFSLHGVPIKIVFKKK